jgi:C5HC2 zinc finger
VNAEELECNYCRANLHISWIKLEDDDEENVYCLKHSLKYLHANRIQKAQCKLLFTYTIEEIEKLIKKLKTRVAIEDNEGQSTSFGENSNSKNKGKAVQKKGHR